MRQTQQTFDLDKIKKDVNYIFSTYEKQFRNFFKEILKIYTFKDVIYTEDDLLGEYYIFVMSHLFKFIDKTGELDITKLFNYTLSKHFQNYIRRIWDIDTNYALIEKLKKIEFAKHLEKNITRKIIRYSKH